LFYSSLPNNQYATVFFWTDFINGENGKIDQVRSAMPPIIMKDCGSGGVSSGSPGENKRREGTGMCDIRKTSNHC
ncbi:hypothetical protein AF383_24485, partial [Salmonella enterica subsp. enterica serovar Typhimurium]